MRLIRPVAVIDAVLVDSNVPESEPVYSGAATYAKDAVVRGNTTDTAHRTFKSLIASNTGQPLTDDTKWLETGATNRWMMFDGSVQSQTTNANSIEVELQSPMRVDSVALLNLDAASVTVTMTDAIDGEVFDETYSLVSPSGIIDWYSYFFEPIERLSDILVTGLPPYANAVVAVSLDDAGGTARCGALVFGQSREIGATQYGASVGILDYSRKERDAFGNFVVVERAFANRADFTVWVEKGLTDQVKNLLSGYRATPIVYVGSEDPQYASTIVYGFFRDFSLELSYPTHSICSLSIEGLT